MCASCLHLWTVLFWDYISFLSFLDSEKQSGPTEVWMPRINCCQNLERKNLQKNPKNNELLKTQKWCIFLHLNSAFHVYWLLKVLCNTFTFPHSHTHSYSGGNEVTLVHHAVTIKHIHRHSHTHTHWWLCLLGQFGLQCLAQGHFDSLCAGLNYQSWLLYLLSHALP